MLKQISHLHQQNEYFIHFCKFVLFVCSLYTEHRLRLRDEIKLTQPVHKVSSALLTMKWLFSYNDVPQVTL